jgi:hypothetical protein
LFGDLRATPQQSLFIGAFTSLNAIRRAFSISTDKRYYGGHEKMKINGRTSEQ